MIKKLQFAVITVGFLMIMFYSRSAYADAGVPMIFITYPAMLLALIPIILIEAVIIERQLRLGFGKTIRCVGIANAASTIVGFPLTWFVWAAFEMAFIHGGYLLYKFHFIGEGFSPADTWGRILSVILFTPWLVADEQHIYWMIPAAAIVGFIPAFFVSVWIERSILRRLCKTIDKPVIDRTTWTANVVSYMLLFIIAVAWLVKGLLTKKIGLLGL